jgi:two-component system, NtrC family, sensor kinase
LSLADVRHGPEARQEGPFSGMDFDFHRIPTILLLGALVPIFWFLYRSNRSYRVRLWLIAWTVVLMRVIVQVFGMRMGMSKDLVNAIDLGALQLSGVVLLLSMTRIFADPAQRWPFFLVVAVPSVAYAELYAFKYSHLWPYLVSGLGLGIGITVWIVLYYRMRLEKYMAAVCVLLLGTTCWGIFRTGHGRPDLGFFTIETLTYALAGFLYWYSYKRLSPGVVLSSVGFLTWAAVFPAFYWLNPVHPKALEALISLSNMPKFWVAIGMIVTLLEDESRSAQLAEAQERSTREQIQGFFQVTSRLLSGADVASFCDEIAQVFTKSSNFRRAAILLTDDQRKLYAAGSSGIGAETLAKLNENVQRWTVDLIETLCESGVKVGPRSFRLNRKQMEEIVALPGFTRYSDTPSWKNGDGILVPLRSPRGLLVGCISLDEPEDVRRVNAEELAALEMLSADLAISIENLHLQRQLVLSEKLAGLGKLVSGAGHEPNNPLTAVLGYSEMLSGSVQDEGTRRGVEVIRREALRMKQIIENLMRFARQTKFERRAIALPPVLDEVINLRAYEIKRRGVQVKIDVAASLPGVLVDEGMLKQVFLNILNNSLEALQDIPGGRLTIDAAQNGNRVQLRFNDNGAGFTNLDRVFDPFFTTKDPGKGPGLGLSVSYGIIKQHGGEISAYNLHPSGACILIELPIAQTAETRLEASVAEG